ncbi:MAG: peptidoglycan DD-metalloendopeptidase family protein [Clostridia bacterium]|nr:peptidoglycan DD-metalloendopeptidase family protein [Clostridia bacterium]
MKRKIIVISLILTFLTLNFRAFAVTLENQQKKVQEDKTNSEKALESITSEKDSVQKEVSDLNNSILNVQSELSDLEDQIEQLDSSIKNKEEDLSSKCTLLDERLSAAYMSNNNTYIEALFSGGIINFISNYDMIRQIAEYDNNIINEVRQAKEELENSKSKLEEVKSEVQKKEQELKSQKSKREEKVKSLSAEEQAIQSEIEQKESELSRINSAIKAEQKRIEEEQKKAAEREAAAKAANQNKPSTGNSNGGSSNNNSNGGPSNNNSNRPSNNSPSSNPSASASMTWPTRITHRVNSVYAPGGRTDTSHAGRAHKGLDIYAPMGTPIYAAQAGTVVYVNYSGYGGGWGLYVVIYHGKDSSGRSIYTRYAHGSAIASGISVGTKVTTNSVIMYSGNTGASEGAHLHFEVCLNSMYNQVNPCPYLGVSNSRGNH